MAEIRFMSIVTPLDHADVIGPAVAVGRRALALGLVPGEGDRDLDLDLLRTVARTAMEDGVGRDVGLELQRDDLAPSRLRVLLERLEAALVGSPMPERELGELWRVLGPETLAALLEISVMSLRRYVAGDRAASDTVAARGHWLALVTGDLAGAYNDLGIRRWFERPRPQLEGRSPRAALGTGWDPDDPMAVRVAGLAAALVGPGTAT